ncbi:MAG: DsrE family protein [Rhodocyclales bacterium]|nr:DsrE family protein [Rhodocyclales bacterium]
MDKLAQRVLAIVLVLFSAVAAASGSKTADANKVIYHINGGLEQATDGLRNIRNHLAVDPGVKIVVVTHYKGIDFLLEGARDKNGNPYDAAVDDLSMKGVEFRVCEFTLKGRNIDKGRVHPEAKIVPSGVAEIGRLQSQEGFAYLKP